MSRAVVLVPLGVDAGRYAAELAEVAAATGASLAFLQAGSPSVTDELDRLAGLGVRQVELVGLGLGAPTARSWLRRVAGHWRRARPEVEVLVGGRAVTGEEAPLRSPAWEDVPGHAHQVLVCRGPRCSARGSAATSAALDAELRARGLGDDDVLVTQTGCLFPCNQAPVVVVHPDDSWYGGVDPDRARAIVADHLVGGLPLPDRLPRARP
ncbi:(2Fe-2S) ferredoxin domain-containing protein [Nocardioides nitrophenolicus]|uniref:(2Fe-2S) ferredoxin domain-containing protein n=1 Tax=Nocardioides nitrophenolicus TaxID=60489 RepID=UPI0027DE7D79|nr:(2Fe-2S) ferredoxin domain-containing protein [Nocardioides nitrophenolicus]MBM7517653.1 (2Fe-2S) ferredoxin [Nocardioides nitrophenolicus]